MEDEQKIDPEEIDGQDGELLADREAMTVLRPPLPVPVDPILPADLQPNDV
jgi:hypothetical protein